MKQYFVCLLMLGGCDFLGSSQPALPYTHSHRELAPYEYELTMESRDDFSADQLKNLFKKHGYELCQDRIYLLRGMREDRLLDEHKIILTGLVDCVDQDYFDRRHKV